MKVLQYSWIFPPHPLAGGKSNVCRSQCKHLALKGHYVTVYTSKRRNFPTIANMEGYTVVRNGSYATDSRILNYPNKLFQQIADVSWLRKKLKKFDVFHVHAPTYGFVPPIFKSHYIFKGWVKALEKTHIPTVVQFHGTIEVENSYIIRNWLEDAKQADFVLTVSQRTRRDLIRLGIRKEIYVLPGGVNLDFFNPEEYPAPENDRFTILCASGNSAAKGFDCAKKAFEILRQKGAKFNAILIGYGLQKVPHDKMPYYYSKADVFILPSLSEGLPLSIIEAMAMKKPVIGSMVGGIPELIEDDKNGFLIPPNDPESLADTLLKLYENSSLRESMGSAGREKVEREFDIRKIAPKLERLYQEMRA